MSDIKVLVPVKRVIDFSVKVRVKQDGSGVETDHVKLSMNPFDEIALEEAVRLKEAGKVAEIIALSIGTQEGMETLREALARGADTAILIETDLILEPFNIAKILTAIIKQQGVTFAILGKQAIDDDCNQTGQMLAGLLGWSQGTYASKLNFIDNKTIEVTREIDNGLEMLRLQLPAVVTADLRLNEPRYISLPNVMRAKNKPLQTLALSVLNLDLKPHTAILKVETPPLRRAGVTLANAKELVEKLIKEAKVIGALNTKGE